MDRENIKEKINELIQAEGIKDQAAIDLFYEMAEEYEDALEDENTEEEEE